MKNPQSHRYKPMVRIAEELRAAIAKEAALRGIPQTVMLEKVVNTGLSVMQLMEKEGAA